MKTADARAWRWYGSHLRPYWRPLALLSLAGTVVALATLPILWMIRHIFDQAIPAQDIAAILFYSVAILVCRVAATTIYLSTVRFCLPAMRRAVSDMRAALVDRLLLLRWADRGLMDGARAYGRVVSDTERVEQLTSTLFQSVVPALLPLLIYVAMLLVLSWQMTLAVVVAATLTKWAALLTARRLRKSIGGFHQRYEDFHVATHRAVQMHRTFSLLGTEKSALAQYRGVVESLAAAGSSMNFAAAVNAQANTLSSTLVATIVLCLGGIAITQGSITFGTVVAFVVAANLTNASVQGLMAAIPQILAGDVALRALSQLNALGERETRGGKAVADFSGPLEMKNVRFSYGDRLLFAAERIGITRGTVTALVAPNGYGKTTVLETLMGLHWPDEGMLLLSGKRLDSLDLYAYRARIGMLPQHPQFVRGSIRENIFLGREPVDDQALARAVRRAGLADVLATLPDGLETMMGDSGDRLSGGERQRVALARALIYSPELLILDEPGNHLDASGFDMLWELLLTAPDHPTIVMATHDRRLLACADQILELKDGVLAAVSPTELAAAS